MDNTEIPVKFAITFPLTGHEPVNGVVFTKEAVEDALAKLPNDLPIICYSNGEPTIVGHTCGKPQKISRFADQNIYLEIEGSINGDVQFEANTNYKNSITTVTDMAITAISLCKG